MISYPFRHNIRFFIFMYILGTICLFTTSEISYSPYFFKQFFELFLDIYIFCAIITILPNPVQIIILLGASSISYFITIVDLFCYIRFGSTLSPSILRLMTETNQAEAIGFLKSYIDTNILLSPLPLIFLLIICHIYCYKASFTKTSIRKNKLIDIATTTLIFISILFSFKNKLYLIHTWRFENLSQIEEYFGKEYYASRAQYLPIYRLIFSIHANQLAKKQIRRLIQISKNIEVDSCKVLSPNIILIFGESYNKHHSQLYGYQLPTTPNQLRRMKEGSLFLFEDAVSPYNITSDVLKCAFSLNDMSKHEDWSEKPLFTMAFKKAGYYVTFISNEFLMKSQENFADFSGGMFLNDPVINDMQFSNRNNKIHNYDEDLIKDYYALHKVIRKQQLTIFSLIGQHVEYKSRFPKSFSIFNKNSYSRPDLTDEEIQILSDYDNATRYNDYVINQIIKIFEKDNAIIIYLPDHGEECFDEIKTFGRLHNELISYEMAKNEFQIPFWIWCSQTYREKNPIIVDNIKAAKHKRFFSDDLSHLMLQLGGIYCNDYRDECNIISPHYNNKKKRLLRGSIDYDLLMH